MENIKSIIINDVLSKIDCLYGFSIFKDKDENSDVYISTKTLEYFYFFKYTAGAYYNLNNEKIALSDINTCKYLTKDLIKLNYRQILNYTNIFIKEHDQLNFINYLSPKETLSNQFLTQGYKAFEREEYQEAIELYSKAIDEKPYDSVLYSKRASCYIKTKNFGKAIEDLCRAGISNPVSEQNIFIFAYEAIANTYRIANDYENAIKYYSLIKNNSEYSVSKKRAFCYVNIGKLDLAIQDLEEILKTDRKIDVLLELGEVYLKAGFIDKGKTVLEEVINCTKNSNEAWVIEMFEELNRPIKDKAKKLLQQV